MGTVTHGDSDTPLYYVWQSMIKRGHNPNSQTYDYYGAKGVTVCDEWRNSYTAFKDWAIQSGYSQELSIDRIAGALVYSPDTCRWATKTTQVRNRGKAKGKSSKYLGVYYRKKYNDFVAQIQVNKQTYYIGLFKTEEDAAKARDQYVKDNNLANYTLNFK